MATAKVDQQLKGIASEANSLNSYLVQSSNGDKEPTALDVAKLGHRNYVSFYSDPSANGDENMVTTDTIELSHTINTNVKEKDYLVVLATGDEELVTTNVECRKSRSLR